MSMKSEVTMTDPIKFKSEGTQPSLRYNICIKFRVVLIGGYFFIGNINLLSLHLFLY